MTQDIEDEQNGQDGGEASPLKTAVITSAIQVR